MLLFVTIFLAVTRFGVSFLLPYVRQCVTSGVGTFPVFRPKTSLTTNPLLSKGDLWLVNRVAPARNSGDSQFSLSASLKLKERSWNPWKQTRTQSRFISAIKQHSLLKWIPATSFTRNWQTGKLETCEASNSGLLSTANQLCSDGLNAVTTQTPEPAEKRVLSFCNIARGLVRFHFNYTPSSVWKRIVNNSRLLWANKYFFRLAINWPRRKPDFCVVNIFSVSSFAVCGADRNPNAINLINPGDGRTQSCGLFDPSLNIVRKQHFTNIFGTAVGPFASVCHLLFQGQRGCNLFGQYSAGKCRNVKGWRIAKVFNWDFYGEIELRFHHRWVVWIKNERGLSNFDFATAYPWTMFSIPLRPNLLIGLFSGEPESNGRSSVNSEHYQPDYLSPKFYRFASLALFLFGDFLIVWGWWDAHYGKRTVWKGLAITSAGMCISVCAVIIFMSYT